MMCRSFIFRNENQSEKAMGGGAQNENGKYGVINLWVRNAKTRLISKGELRKCYFGITPAGNQFQNLLTLVEYFIKETLR